MNQGISAGLQCGRNRQKSGRKPPLRARQKFLNRHTNLARDTTYRIGIRYLHAYRHPQLVVPAGVRGQDALRNRPICCST